MRGEAEPVAIGAAHRQPGAQLTGVFGQVGGAHHVREAEAHRARRNLPAGRERRAARPSARTRRARERRAAVADAGRQIAGAGLGRVAGAECERRAVLAVGCRAGLRCRHQREVQGVRALGADVGTGGPTGSGCQSALISPGPQRIRCRSLPIVKPGESIRVVIRQLTMEAGLGPKPLPLGDDERVPRAPRGS